jgi:NAD(P)-dependent dehydrogenase (short-subunit alcohol dehydrogenase family)
LHVREFIKQLNAVSPESFYIGADVSADDDRRRLIDETLKRTGRIDALVNNAGIAPDVRADMLSMTRESIDKVMGVNLYGMLFLTQYAAKTFIAQGGGTVINVTSRSAYTSSVNRAEYCISKAGASMASMLFADRLSEYGINVYEIRPGIIETDMTSGVKEKYEKLIVDGLLPVKRMGKPEDVAFAILSLAQGALPYSTGEVINVDGGFHLRRL